MTANQIAYASANETQRHNQEMEKLAASELSTKQKQADAAWAQAQTAASRAAEEQRANLERERQNWWQMVEAISETSRHNLNTERIAGLTYESTAALQRAQSEAALRQASAAEAQAAAAASRASTSQFEAETNRAKLGIESAKINLGYANVALGYSQLAETNRANVAKELETSTHNRFTEAETTRSNVVKESETRRHNKATEATDRTKASAQFASAAANVINSGVNVVGGIMNIARVASMTGG